MSLLHPHSHPPFALAPYHLNDGLWGWKDLCCSWSQMAISVLIRSRSAEDPESPAEKHMPDHICEPGHGLQQCALWEHLGWVQVCHFLPCFQKRCHRSSGMLPICMPLTSMPNIQKLSIWTLFLQSLPSTVASDSVCKALVMSGLLWGRFASR